MSTINPQDFITLSIKQDEIRKIVLNQLGMINVKWSEYKFLYSTPAYQQVMTEVAATFFYLQQESQMRDILQSLSRLYDRAVMGSDETCSLHWLADSLPACTAKTLLDNALAAIRPKFANIKTWRNKMGSHNDYSHISNLAPNAPLLHLSEIDEVIKLTNEAYNIIAAHDSRQAGTYPFDIPVIQGSESLIRFLQEYIQAHRKHRST